MLFNERTIVKNIIEINNLYFKHSPNIGTLTIYVETKPDHTQLVVQTSFHSLEHYGVGVFRGLTKIIDTKIISSNLWIDNIKEKINWKNL